MLEILGYIVVAYGVARLLQTVTGEYKAGGPPLVIGVLGVAVLVVLAIMLHQQAEGVGDLGSGL